MKTCMSLLALTLICVACSPKVGSEKWCAAMKKKSEADWTLNEAKDYAKHCLFK